jgi:hypothetical protein
MPPQQQQPLSWDRPIRSVGHSTSPRASGIAHKLPTGSCVGPAALPKRMGGR